MSLLERGTAAVMTGQAKGYLRLDKEIFLVRAVGTVTCSASLRFQDRMYRFLFIVLLLMALIAQFLSLRLEQMTCL